MYNGNQLSRMCGSAVGIVQAVLIILKLIGVLHCSWWQVFIPIWLCALIFILSLAVLILVLMVDK